LEKYFILIYRLRSYMLIKAFELPMQLQKSLKKKNRATAVATPFSSLSGGEKNSQPRLFTLSFILLFLLKDL
jgi:hypothetical protein